MPNLVFSATRLYYLEASRMEGINAPTVPDLCCNEWSGLSCQPDLFLHLQEEPTGHVSNFRDVLNGSTNFLMSHLECLVQIDILHKCCSDTRSKFSLFPPSVCIIYSQAVWFSLADSSWSNFDQAGASIHRILSKPWQLVLEMIAFLPRNKRAMD